MRLLKIHHLVAFAVPDKAGYSGLPEAAELHQHVDLRDEHVTKDNALMCRDRRTARALADSNILIVQGLEVFLDLDKLEELT